MDLSLPRPKRNCRLPKPKPLPLIETKNGKFHKFQGIFDGFAVSIKEPMDMKKIVSMGFFGKASLSRSYPKFDGTMEKPELIRRRQYERRKNWKDKFKMKNKKKVILVPNSDDEKEEYFTNLQAVYEIDGCGDKEIVNLMLEEAFFLQNALECLDIFYGNKLVDSLEIWDLFTQSDFSFQHKYAVYYHFRSKNWVVKPGIKFGGDFLLYKEGPPFYHASYVVLIQNIQKDEDNEINTTALMGLHRMIETAGKELLICELDIPKARIQPEDLSKLKIKEVLMKRWISSQERQENS